MNVDKEELREKLYKTGEKKDFIHLHLHSDFSLKDGIGKPNQYAKKAIELGMPAVAITDHGSIGAHPSFFMFCRSNGIKPIVGVEMYLQDRRQEIKEIEEILSNINEKIKMLKLGLKHRKANKKYITTYIEYFRKMLNHPDIEYEEIAAMDYLEVREAITDAHALFVNKQKEIVAEREIIRKNQHIVLLAKNEKGRRNITKIVSDAARNGFYYKSRTSFDFLAKNHEGIIAMSACLAGIINNKMLKYEDEDEAIKAGIEEAQKYKDVFGDDFYIEIMTIDIDKQRKVNKLLLEVAKKLDIKFVVTNDVHYLNFAGAKAQEISLMLGSKDDGGDQVTMKDKKRQSAIKEILTAIGDDHSSNHIKQVHNDFMSLDRFQEFKPTTNDTKVKTKTSITINEISDILSGKVKFKRIWEFSTKDFWFKDRHEMVDVYIDQEHYKQISPEDFITALDNTLKVSETIETWNWDTKEKLPKIDPQGFDNTFDLLVSLVRDGWKRKAKDEWYNTDNVYVKRVKYELSVIRRIDLADYFIIVADYIKFAKNNGVLVGAARGSAAGSLVCYLLDITNVDPVVHELLFERFLSMSRSMAIFDFALKDFATEDVESVDIDQSNKMIQEWYENDRLVKLEE